jgi:glycosyltransferase involved in cell wall biosynthesis
MKAANESHKVWILSDHQILSYRIVGELRRQQFERLGYKVKIVQTPETTADRFVLAAECRGSLILHNTLGFFMYPLPDCVNIALPGHEWDRYPARWVDLLNAFDQVWSYSTHVADTLVRSGVRRPVVFQPLPVDIESVPEKTSYETSGSFRFLSCGEPHFRKGFHLLLLGFQKAFPQIGEATLTIKTSPGCQWVSPREDIEIFPEHLPRKDLLSLYNRFDAYVTASLAEGLGMTVAEAVMAGLPVAANHWGGHRDLLDEGDFFPIHYTEVEQPFCSNPDYYAEGQRCALSSSDSIAETLRSMVNTSPSERAAKSIRARIALKKRFSLERTKVLIAKQLKSF